MLTMKQKSAPRRRADALRALAGLGPVIEGSLCRADRGGSPRRQLTDRPAGRTRTLYVPAGRAGEVLRWAENWKRARALLKELSEASREELRECAGRAAIPCAQAC